MDTTAFPDDPNSSVPQMPTQWPQVYSHSASHDPKLNPNSPVLPQFVPLALPSIASQPPDASGFLTSDTALHFVDPQCPPVLPSICSSVPPVKPIPPVQSQLRLPVPLTGEVVDRIEAQPNAPHSVGILLLV